MWKGEVERSEVRRYLEVTLWLLNLSTFKASFQTMYTVCTAVPNCQVFQLGKFVVQHKGHVWTTVTDDLLSRLFTTVFPRPEQDR